MPKAIILTYNDDFFCIFVNLNIFLKRHHVSEIINHPFHSFFIVVHIKDINILQERRNDRI